MKNLLPVCLVLAALLATDVALAASAKPATILAAEASTLATTANSPGRGQFKRKKHRKAAYQRLRKRRH